MNINIMRRILVLALVAIPSAGFVLSSSKHQAGVAIRRVLGEDPRKSPHDLGESWPQPCCANGLRTLEDFEIYDLLLQRSVQMLWTGLDEGNNANGRAWLLGQQHKHLAPYWHSILGLSLSFDNYLVQLFETSSTVAPWAPASVTAQEEGKLGAADDTATRPHHGENIKELGSSSSDCNAPGSERVNSLRSVSRSSRSGRAYSTNQLVRTLVLLLHRCSDQWVTELRRMADADSPQARKAKDKERRRLQALLRQGHKKHFQSATQQVAAAQNASSPSASATGVLTGISTVAGAEAASHYSGSGGARLVRRPPSRLANELEKLDADPLASLWPQNGASKGRNTAGNLSSRLRYENAELLCRVTTLMAADSLRDDLFRKALEPTSKQQNDVEAAWFHSRVYEPWIEALSEVTASKEVMSPPTCLSIQQQGLADCRRQPAPPPKPLPKPPSVAYNLLSSLHFSLPQEVAGTIVEPERFVNEILNRRASAAKALMHRLEFTEVRVLGVKRKLLERASLKKALRERAIEEGFYPPTPAPSPDGAPETWLWHVVRAIKHSNGEAVSLVENDDTSGKA